MTVKPDSDLTAAMKDESFDEWLSRVKSGQFDSIGADHGEDIKSQVSVPAKVRLIRTDGTGVRPDRLLRSLVEVYGSESAVGMIGIRAVDDDERGDCHVTEVYLDPPSLDFLIWKLTRVRDALKT